MREVTLKEYSEEKGRLLDVADLMRVTPAAITKMLNSNRDIRVVVDRDGVPTRAYEIKRFPRNTES